MKDKKIKVATREDVMNLKGSDIKIEEEKKLTDEEKYNLVKRFSIPPINVKSYHAERFINFLANIREEIINTNNCNEVLFRLCNNEYSVFVILDNIKKHNDEEIYFEGYDQNKNDVDGVIKLPDTSIICEIFSFNYE